MIYIENAIKIINILCEKSPKKIDEFIHETGSSRISILTWIDFLKKKGFVVRVKTKESKTIKAKIMLNIRDTRLKHIYSITEKGRKFAKLLL